MLRPNKKIVRAVLISLMLIVGSVQAQVSYSCSMMDMVIHDDCCCADAGVDDMMVADIEEPCCEKVVELSIDTSTDQVQQKNQQIKFKSDVDPPDIVASAVGYSLQFTYCASFPNVKRSANSYSAGNAIYLITQRLRI